MEPEEPTARSPGRGVRNRAVPTADGARDGEEPGVDGAGNRAVTGGRSPTAGPRDPPRTDGGEV